MAGGEGFWHRMGDTGYFDEAGRLWFCGRKAHIVFTETERLFSVRCEAIFNQHPQIYRCALVGLGTGGIKTPAIVAEPEAGEFPTTAAREQQLKQELLAMGQECELTRSIQTIILHRSLPVDTRHNVKINREKLAVWATDQI